MEEGKVGEFAAREISDKYMLMLLEAALFSLNQYQVLVDEGICSEACADISGIHQIPGSADEVH